MTAKISKIRQRRNELLAQEKALEQALAAIERSMLRLRKHCKHPARALLRRWTSCEKHWSENYWSLCRDCGQVFFAKDQRPLSQKSSPCCTLDMPREGEFYEPRKPSAVYLPGMKALEV